MLFATIQQAQPPTLRHKLRDTLLSTAGQLANVPMVADICLDMPRVQFLFIHHLLQDEVDSFRKLLRVLSLRHTFISYSEAVHRINTGNIDKPYICFSSDDGYKSNLRAAAVLAEFGISACFFLCPSIISESDTTKITRFCKERLRFGLTMKFMTWQEVATLQTMGHEIGSHTNTHIDVGQESPEKIAEEFGMSKYILTEECGTINHLALPFGRFDKVEKSWWATAQKAGYSSCASATNGCHKATDKDTDVSFLRRNLVLPQWGVSQHLAYLLYNSI